MVGIDLFSGAGGFTTGAVQAGIKVVWAANHHRPAVEIHRANHPGVVHSCQDLQQANFHEIPRHSLCLASPSCVGHTNARGRDRGPVHDKARSTAWAVVTELEVNRPEVCVIENVPEFRRWTLYPAFEFGCRALGYSIAPHVLDAADFGVPQHRKRLFLVLTRSLAPLQLRFERQPPRAIGPLLDWTVDDRWSPIYRPNRSAKQIQKIEKWVQNNPDKPLFVLCYFGASGGRSLERPIGALETRNHYALVNYSVKKMRMLTVQEARTAMGFPENYLLPNNQKEAFQALGNAVCPPVAKAILEKIRRCV